MACIYRHADLNICCKNSAVHLSLCFILVLLKYPAQVIFGIGYHLVMTRFDNVMYMQHL